MLQKNFSKTLDIESGERSLVTVGRTTDINKGQDMKIVEAWHNAPWTPRGRKFKYVIENIIVVGGFFLAMGIAGRFE